MQLLGVTRRWYHEPSLRFWNGARDDQQPSLTPDLSPSRQYSRRPAFPRMTPSLWSSNCAATGEVKRTSSAK
jgi:hypothetical protein